MPAPEPIRILPPSAIEVLDQTLLPQVERYIRLDSIDTVCEAISRLRVRGAPLLGLIGACGVAIAASQAGAGRAEVGAAARRLIGTRPTAVDLGSGVRASLVMARGEFEAGREPAAALWRHALELHQQRISEDAAMGRLGAALLPEGAAVLTHCNTGALATAGIGTALGVISTAWDAGHLVRCYATETRPLLQGARLTMWELTKRGIPATLLPDTAAASIIASGKIQAVITGADRIARNGDAANKVGTYGLAAVAARHGVPFYIAAPTSTFDAACPDGAAIPIEFRADDEVGGFGDQRWSPAAHDSYNPAFDVTPAELIGAFITERAVLRPPFTTSIAAFLGLP